MENLIRKYKISRLLNEPLVLVGKDKEIIDFISNKLKGLKIVKYVNEWGEECHYINEKCEHIFEYYTGVDDNSFDIRYQNFVEIIIEMYWGDDDFDFEKYFEYIIIDIISNLYNIKAGRITISYLTQECLEKEKKEYLSEIRKHKIKKFLLSL